MSRRRRLSDEDQALWDRVADKTEPLDPKRPKPVVRPKMAKPGINARNPDSVPLPAFRVSEKAAPRGPGHDLQKPWRERLSGAHPIHSFGAGVGQTVGSGDHGQGTRQTG